MAISVGRISAVQTNTPILFKGKNENLNEKANHSTNQTKNTLLGLGALAALGVASVFMHNKALVKKAAQELEQLKNSTKLNLNDFKKVGNFDKGVATIDGKGFNGQIVTPKTVLEYKDGVIQKSQLNTGDIKTYCNFEGTKHYEMKPDGKLKTDGSVLKYVTINGKTTGIHRYKDGTVVIESQPNKAVSTPYYDKKNPGVWLNTTVKPNGSITRLETIQANISHPNFRNGKIQPIKKVTDLETRNVLEMGNRVPLSVHPNRYKQHVFVDGKKVTAVYENGKFEYANSVEFNPKTGVYKKQYYKLDNNGKLIPKNSYCETDKNTGAYLTYELENGNKTKLYFADPYNGTYKSKCKIHDGSRYTTDIEQIKKEIERMGLKFTV